MLLTKRDSKDYSKNSSQLGIFLWCDYIEIQLTFFYQVP